MTKINIPSDKSYGYHVPPDMMLQKELFIHSQANHEKHQTNPNYYLDQYKKYLTTTLQNYQGHKKQEKTEKLSQIREELGEMATKCNVVSQIRPLEENKDISGKTGKISIKYVVNSIVSMFTSSFDKFTIVT